MLLRRQLVLFTSLFVLACDPSGDKDHDGDDEGAEGEAGETGDTGDTAEPAASCAEYCDAFAAHCTGANSDYADAADCMTKCGAFVQGSPGVEEENTLECRWVHAQEANEDDHCQEAGFMSTSCV